MTSKFAFIDAVATDGGTTFVVREREIQQA